MRYRWRSEVVMVGQLLNSVVTSAWRCGVVVVVVVTKRTHFCNQAYVD